MNKQALYGVYYKGRLVYYSTNKRDCLRYVGKHQMSAYIGIIEESELHGSRSQGSPRDN